MIPLLNRAAEAWFGWMWPMFWQVNLLIVVVWLIDAAIRRWAWPQVRYALWLLVLLKLVIPPTWNLPVSATQQLARPVVERFELQTELATRTSGNKSLQTPLDDAPATATAADTGAPSDPLAAVSSGLVWQVWPLAIWLVGMGMFGILLWRQLRNLRRWHDAQQPRQTIPPWYHELLVEITSTWRMGQLPAIVFSEQVTTPAVCGVLKPVLFLPRNYLDSLSREEARHVLLHELAHMKRGDLWLHAAAMALQIIYWFNPLLALARGQIQHVREICCDLTVAGTLREQTDGYRNTLLGTARELLSENLAPGLGLLGVFEEPFRLVPRLRWLERPSWQWRRQAVATAAIVVAVSVPLLLPMGIHGAPAGLMDNGILIDDLAVVSQTLDSYDDAASPADLALYQKNVTHRMRLVLGFRVETQRIGFSEVWVGSGWVVEKSGGRTLIVDFDKNVLTFIDHDREAWATTPLPLDLDELCTPEVRQQLRHQRTNGEVTLTGRTREVQDISCAEYRVDQWRERNGRFSDHINLKVFASEEPAFDRRVFAKFLDVLRRLHDRHPEYRQQLQKIRGLQLRLELTQGPLLRQIKLVDQLEEIELVPVPIGLLEVPAGYEQVAQLSEVR